MGNGNTASSQIPKYGQRRSHDGLGHRLSTQWALLKRIVEEDNTKRGRAFDLTIQSLIVFSLITSSIETLPDLSPATLSWLAMADLIVVGVFTVEYLLRICVASHKLGYIFSFFGLIDLFAILPFYIASGVDLRAVRAFRLLRLIRILKLARYNKAVERLYRASIIAKEEIILFCVVTVLLLYLSAVGIYYFEHDVQPEQFASIFHSLWWAIVTFTTVGYGDVYPVTVGGKIFTFCVLLIGLGLISIPAGLMASAISKARENEE